MVATFQVGCMRVGRSLILCQVRTQGFLRISRAFICVFLGCMSPSQQRASSRESVFFTYLRWISARKIFCGLIFGCLMNVNFKGNVRNLYPFAIRSQPQQKNILLHLCTCVHLRMLNPVLLYNTRGVTELYYCWSCAQLSPRQKRKYTDYRPKKLKKKINKPAMWCRCIVFV